MKRGFFFVALFFAMFAEAQQFELRSASGALTAAENTTPVTGLSDFGSCTVFLDVTTITTPDSDDEVDFYLQTTYNGGVSWTDVENVHFAIADNGNTATRILFIDGAKEGPGTIQSITGTDRAVNTEISEVVPANTIWLLESFRFTLVTDANAAARQSHLIIGDGTTTLLNLPTTGTQIESLTRNYNAHALGGLIVPTGSEIDIGLPSDVVLHGGYTLATETTLIKAGDNYGPPQIWVQAQHDSHIHTSGTIGDNLKSYDRPLGTAVRISTAVAGGSAPTYAYSAQMHCNVQ